MKSFYYIIILIIISFFTGYSQSRDYKIHSRGMLRQTVYNTGELGRQYDNGTAGMLKDFSSLEWPPNGYQIVDRLIYYGYHNSFGGGLWIAGTRKKGRSYMYCGALSDGDGKSTTIENAYSIPLAPVDRIENYPVLADGNLNSGYNPNEAEETIISKWKTLDTLGITIKRTSRAWSFPGYDSFIIYEYELENTTADTIYDGFIAFPYGFCPSMFGMQRAYNRWAEADLRVSDQFARFDLKRYMTYQHNRNGQPDSAAFDLWSTPGNRGGLNSPQAVGLMVLHYDYEHLALRGQTKLTVTGADTVSWDIDPLDPTKRRIKQPFLNRYENGNLYPSKVSTWLDPLQVRKTRPYRMSDTTFFRRMDSLKIVNNIADTNTHYWLGRVRPSSDLGNAQPASHGYGFGPYTIPPHDKLMFAVAEVVGYGPGRAGDSVYCDLGGGVRYTDAEPFLNPVPSLYRQTTYPGLGAGKYIGSDYLQTHSLPWYVTPGVVSIRDVADRAIQLYTGQQLLKYDTLQFMPELTASTGAYNTIPIPFPAPQFYVEDTRIAINKLVWKPVVESFTSPRLRAPFHHYELLHAVDPLGPWSIIDSVFVRDSKYFHDSEYVVYDTSSTLGMNYYYCIRSVDSLGGKSGMTNIITHNTQSFALPPPIGKVYVIPNPLIVTNGYIEGADDEGELSDKIQFVGLTAHCTIRIFSYSGQLIATIEHNANGQAQSWHQVSRNKQLIASGVYFFVVEDLATGTRSHGKFVVIH
jgi:hypothetical protein